MLNCDFLGKSVGVVSPPHFVHDFSRKIFVMLYSVNWTSYLQFEYLKGKIHGHFNS